MTTTALSEPPEDLRHTAGPLPGVPPLLDLVPQAGPPVFVYAGFGVVLLLLLVAGAVLVAPVLLVRGLRGHRPHRFSLPVPRVHRVKVRRVSYSARASPRPTRRRSKPCARACWASPKRRHSAMTGSPLDRRNWTPWVQLDPQRHYTVKKNNVISRELRLGETGFEPATARPPAGRFWLSGTDSAGLERIELC